MEDGRHRTPPCHSCPHPHPPPVACSATKLEGPFHLEEVRIKTTRGGRHRPERLEVKRVTPASADKDVERPQLSGGFGQLLWEEAWWFLMKSHPSVARQVYS